MRRQKYQHFLSVSLSVVLIILFFFGNALAVDRTIIIRFGSIYAAATPTGKAAEYFAKLVEELASGL